MQPIDTSTEQLLRHAMKDETAFREVFERYRPKLIRAVSFRMDPRLAVRVEPDDVVQDTMAEVHRRLPEFLEKDGYSFYAWIRKIAMSRLQDAHRRHIQAAKRSICREDDGPPKLPDESVFQLADRIAASDTTPSAEVRKRESLDRLQEALAQLDDSEREVLILKYIEDLDSSAIAAIEGISERSVRRRHRHAIEKLGRHLRQAGLDSSA